MPRRLAVLFAVLLFATTGTAAPPIDARSGPIDRFDPYYPHRDSPRLTTPEWIGEPGVEAVVVLAIDDMRDPAVYETYLRPILDRLKKIDGRAPVSIMTCQVKPDDPRLQGWLKEGLSIEVHTIAHPCPCLQKGDFDAAAGTYHDCVDLLNRIPGNTPVAFRMPCCDSLNTVSPRFFAEIFSRASQGQHRLSIDSSVFCVLSADDPALPRNLVLDPDGQERFRKYIPFPSFVNTIENYPYPYLIGGSIWEFPCIVPSDWEAQNLLKPGNPKMLEDMKALLDAVVIKKGVFDLVFHPYGWIKNEQVADLVDYADRKYGKKVKFLNFREAMERLKANVPADHPVRTIGDRSEKLAVQHPLPSGAALKDDQGRDAGLRFVDIDEDGHEDVVFSNDEGYGIYLFDPETKGWTRKVAAGKAGDPMGLPRIVHDGKNNGFFVHSRTLWWQNEHTASLPNLVDRRTFNDLLKDVEPRGKTPAASLKSIRVEAGFTVKLVASEPLVADPIAFDWDADGTLWVVEMGDYPLGGDGHGKPAGKILRLHDRDGNGRYDQASTFLDDLTMPTGIMAWRGGVLIASAPDIIFAEDRDGDGRADHREVLFTGFVEGNPQHRVNGFELGLDGWVYGANGDSGGTVRSVKTGRTVSISGRDFRFQPDTGAFEAESGRTQYGRHRDDWGHWFGNNNPNWGWHYVLSDRELSRNPRFAAPDPRQTLEPETRLFPISRTLARFNDPGAANHVTSANSITPDRDDLFGPRFGTTLFVSEPVHNVVHRIVLEPNGVTFRGRRGPGETGNEFLASSDHWFRPTLMKTGPDGALWIADMYRAVIEHPKWIPDDWEKRLDLRAGSRQGRIYRVVPVDRKPRPIPKLDQLDEAGLVAALESPNGWQRDNAQRLLLHHGGTSAFPMLRALAASTKRPETRVQAIWTLADLGGLDEASAMLGLTDTDPRVREAIITAVEPLLKTSRTVGDAVLRLADDSAPRVRFRTALLLGRWDDHRAGEALTRIAKRDSQDQWMRAAILCSAIPHMPTLLAGLLGDEKTSAPTSEIVKSLLAMAGDDLDDSAIRSISRPTGPDGQFDAWQFSALDALLTARERAKSPDSTSNDPRFAPVWEAARRRVADEATDESQRLAAVALLRHSAAREPEDFERLAQLLQPQTSVALQEAVVASLAQIQTPKVAKVLLDGWKGYTPRVRVAVLDAIASRPEWRSALIAAIETGRIGTGVIDPSHRQRLLNDRDPKIRKRAEVLFERPTQARAKVIAAYQSALGMKGNSNAGATVFRKLCASCHRLDNEGFEVGPDLATLKDRSPAALFTAILDPNRAVESKYAAFSVATVDGRVLDGIIDSESATSVTLKRQEGKVDVLLRTDIDAMATTGQSLMPEGIEKDLTPRDLADLLAFLGQAGSAVQKSE